MASPPPTHDEDDAPDLRAIDPGAMDELGDLIADAVRSRQELALFVLSLDVPACDCKIKKESVCVLAHRPCARRRRKMAKGEKPSCDCPKSAPPCHHILALQCGLEHDELIELLWAAFPGDYESPPPPPFPAKVTRAHLPGPRKPGDPKPYIEVMERRVMLGYQPTHPLDKVIEFGDKQGAILHNLENGSHTAGRLISWPMEWFLKKESQ